MKNRLSERLGAVYDLVTDGSVVADVGCDHAFLSIALVSDGRAPRAYACDVNRGPLDKASENIEAAGLSERITIVLSDGLAGLTEPVDSIVICGMGGPLIISILQSGLGKARHAKELILSPQSDAASVRCWLQDNDFSLEEEKAVIDSGKYYEIIRVVPSEAAQGWGDGSNFSMKYGPYLLAHRDEVLIARMKKRIRVIEEILEGIDVSSPRYEELKGEEELCRNFVK